MAYELRVAGQSTARFDTPEQAEACARDMLLKDADSVIEIIDLSTGRPYAPAASAEDRESLARNVGF